MKRKRLFYIVLVAGWMVLIFGLSHQPATDSNGLSKGIAEKIVEVIENVAPDVEFNLRNFNHILRKNAHFFAYLILGILVSNVLKSIGISKSKGIIIALIICVLYAVSDEVHQLFVPGRGGRISDVFIDSLGAMVGIMWCYKDRLDR